MKYVPHDYQQDITRHQLMKPRQATWAGMGRGKTSSTLTTLDILQLETARPALVLAPKRVARNVWPREMTKWDHLSGEVAVVAQPSAADRLAILRQSLRRGNASLYTINYDNIPWLVETLADLKIKWPFYTIVADEMTRLKSFRLKQGGKRAAALKKVAFEAKRFMGLTGTPAPNGYLDLWGQFYFVDAGTRLGDSFTDYRNRWFRKDHDGYSYEMFDHSKREIDERLKDVALTVEGFSVDAPIVNKVMVELPVDVRRQYAQMEKDFYAEVKGKGIEAVHAANKSSKLLQFSSGAVYYTEEDENLRKRTDWIDVHDEKLDALESVIEEAGGMPVMVVYWWKPSLAKLKKRFPQGRELDEKQSTEDAWNAGKIPVLFVHPQSAGHGLNLQYGSNIMAFFDVDWGLEGHDQVIERIGPVRQKQAGFNRPVYIHYILGENTMDEVVLERLVSKRSVQDLLMEAMIEREVHG